MRASGGTLTVGELREALEGLDDAAPVYDEGLPVLEAEATGAGLELLVDRPRSYCAGGCEW